jgi:hypothetical protein
MKRLLIIAVGAALLQGCVSTHVEHPSGWVLDRKAFLYPFAVGSVYYSDEAGFEIKSYDTDGGAETAGKVAEGVARGLK